jgi:hypothetical protein
MAWRHSYARGLKAVRTLHGGGTHPGSTLIGPGDSWGQSFLARLRESADVVEVGHGMYRAESTRALGRILSDERQFIALLDLGSSDYAHDANVLLREQSLAKGSRVIERLVEIFGPKLLQERFDVAAPRLRALQALSGFSPRVVEAFEQNGLSAMHAVALGQGPRDEAKLLALIALCQAHALTSRELQGIASRVRNGWTVERAALEAGLDEAMRVPEESIEDERPAAESMSVSEYAALQGVTHEAIYRRLRLRRKGEPFERVDLEGGYVAIAPAARGNGVWTIVRETLSAPEAAPESPQFAVADDDSGKLPVATDDAEFSERELLAASFKANMAALDMMSRVYRIVAFLARELGYKEEADAGPG